MTARLPDFVVVGAPRSGTTTVSWWLSQHPGVAFSAKKELEFFDLYYSKGLDWYLEQLPADPGTRLVAEATPTYLSEPGVAELMAADLPGHARFLALLREPAARAWSNYWFLRQLGVEGRRWKDVVGPGAETDPLGYLWRGRYADQLARWDQVVGPDRMHVVVFDDLAADPVTTYAGICRFAGIEVLEPPGREAVNPSRQPRSARLQHLLQSPHAGRLRTRLFLWNAQGKPLPRLDPDEHRALKEAYRPYNERLQERLGRELPAHWWP